MSSMLWKVRWTFVSQANSSVGTQSCATPPGRSAGLPDPTRPWYVRVLDSTSRHRYTGQQPGTKSACRPADLPRLNRGFCSSVGFKYEVDCRASEESFRTVFSIRWGAREWGCPLAGSSQRRPVLPQPRPVPPLRRAPPRPDRPVVCPGFGFHKFPDILA